MANLYGSARADGYKPICIPVSDPLFFFFFLDRTILQTRKDIKWVEERGLCFSCSASTPHYFFFARQTGPDSFIILCATLRMMLRMTSLYCLHWKRRFFYDLIHHHMEEFFFALCKHRILVDISTYREHARFRHRDPKKNIRNWAGTHSTHVLCNHYPGRIRKALCLSSLSYNDDLL